MKNISKLISAAGIAAATIATPALAAHKGKPVSTRQGERSGIYNSIRGTPSCPGLPYCDPATGISYPRGEPGGSS